MIIFFFRYNIYRNRQINGRGHPLFFIHRLVGDNIDYHVQARYQSTKRTNQSIHWTQQYAVLDRIDVSLLDNSKPQMKLKDLQLANVLPSHDVLNIFKRNCSILVSRVISKYIDSFKHVRDCVIRHIPHKNSKEMSQKSNIVSHQHYKKYVRLFVFTH